MIPKIIHYCWFGNAAMPELVLQCIASWEKYLPDYKIMKWNEENFEITLYPYASEAYQERKFAFVADVCRLYALKTVGGIYLDTDVEFLKPLDNQIINTEAFTGFEGNLLLSSAIMGSIKNGEWIEDLLKYYENRSFYLKNGKLDVNPNTESITSFMKEKKGLIIDNSYQDLAGYCTVYPSDYFSPKSWKTLKINMTSNTYSIHHFAASWTTESNQSFVGKTANLILGKRTADFLAGKFRKLKG